MPHNSQLLLTGARVYTADQWSPWAEAVLIEGNRIVHVGQEPMVRAAADSGAEEIRVEGGLLVPGINDSHIHMSYGAHALRILHLEGLTTSAQILSAVCAYAAAHPEREWIEAYGALYEAFEGLEQLPRALLDEAVPDRPVFVRAIDHHSAWCNSAALRIAGIDRGARVPLPNEVVVDSATGLATGWLKEREAYGLVAAHMPTFSEEEDDSALNEAIRYVNRFGITSVQNMDGDRTRLKQYERLHDRGQLSVRAAHYLSVREHAPKELLPRYAECVRERRDAWNHVPGIKLFIDGVVESRTALLFDPYTDGGGETGVPDMDPDAYRAIVTEADGLGMSIATHAIGDRGVHLALDAYESVCKGGSNGLRHRIEHIEVVRRQDLPRFKAAGVTASMQPYHAAATTNPQTSLWTRLVGPAREPYAFAWRSVIESGACLAFGSDWSIVSPDPRLGLKTALTRTTPSGDPVGGWQPQQNITLAQALDAYTRTAAYVEGQDGVKGVLRTGMLADITVFSEDLFRLHPDDFLSVGVALTIVDGRIVHRTI
jgi:predicted amidohydrolase YtcJ